MVCVVLRVECCLFVWCCVLCVVCCSLRVGGRVSFVARCAPWGFIRVCYVLFVVCCVFVVRCCVLCVGLLRVSDVMICVACLFKKHFLF